MKNLKRYILKKTRTVIKFSFLILLNFSILKVYGINKQDFLECLSTPPQWMTEQIQEDLNCTQASISSSEIQTTLSKYPHLLHLKLKNQKVVIESKNNFDHHIKIRCQIVIDALNNLLSLVPLPDMNLLIALGDYFSSDTPLPIFTFSKQKHHPVILMPDVDALQGYGKHKKRILKGNKMYPWLIKKNKMFWRGGDTGIVSISNWKESPRPRLVLLSLDHQSILDAKFSYFHEHPELKAECKKLGIHQKKINSSSYCRYKYLIDIDGNTTAWSRYFSLLLSNSVCLKVITNNIQWFYKGLEPYKHYIPVNENLSDIFEQFNWAKKHDRESKNIAQSATDFAKSYLFEEGVYAYLYLLLKHYSEMLRQNDLESS
jgi:hypothetical protein